MENIPRVRVTINNLIEAENLRREYILKSGYINFISGRIGDLSSKITPHTKNELKRIFWEAEDIIRKKGFMTCIDGLYPLDYPDLDPPKKYGWCCGGGTYGPLSSNMWEDKDVEIDQNEEIIPLDKNLWTWVKQFFFTSIKTTKITPNSVIEHSEIPYYHPMFKKEYVVPDIRQVFWNMYDCHLIKYINKNGNIISEKQSWKKFKKYSSDFTLKTYYHFEYNPYERCKCECKCIENQPPSEKELALKEAQKVLEGMGYNRNINGTIQLIKGEAKEEEMKKAYKIWETVLNMNGFKVHENTIIRI
jgi:hypothetical protein